MKQIAWGIIGCGHVTEVKSGPAFNKVPHSRLVAVMRRNAEKAKDYAERHHVSKWYNDASKLINDPEVNAIYIATPPLYHEQYAIEALQAGKDVYLEKPMAMSKEAAERINSTAIETGRKLSIAHYRRQLPLFKKVKEFILAKLIGEIRCINLKMYQPYNAPLITRTEDNWRVNPAISGGGLFHDLAPHQLDLLMHFFGKPIKSYGISLNQGKYYEADDVVQASFVFERNIVFSGLWCFTVHPGQTRDECEILGSTGKLVFSIFKHDELLFETNGETSLLSFENPLNIQLPMIEQVVQYFLGQSENPCSGEEGVEVMRMIDEIVKKH